MAFRPPRPQSGGWSTAHWTAWLVDQGVVHSVRPAEPRTCRLCSAPSRLDGFGMPYPTCFACGRFYSQHLRRIVPITYSLSPHGLTSLIAQAKNDGDRSWLRWPLAALLHQFFQLHWRCLEATIGGPIDMVIPIPSHASTRAGADHLLALHDSIRPWLPIDWTHGVLMKNQPSTANTRRRTVADDVFTVSPWHDVRGRRTVLVDDLCTSGGTLASAAAALRAAGAEMPVAVTIGRQVGFDDPSAQTLIQQLPGRGWDPTTCAVHPSGSPIVTQARPWG